MWHRVLTYRLTFLYRECHSFCGVISRIANQQHAPHTSSTARWAAWSLPGSECVLCMFLSNAICQCYTAMNRAHTGTEQKYLRNHTVRS